MWCLETIVAINEKLAHGASLAQAYKACGIKMTNEKPIREIQQQPRVVDRRPLMKAAS